MGFTPNINLETPANGDYLDTWDSPVNLNWDKIDALFDATRSDMGGSGHVHDGTAGQGPQVDHDELLNAGTVSHADLDSEITQVRVTSNDGTVDYIGTKLQAGSGITLTELNDGGDEKLEIASTGGAPTLGDVNDPTGQYGWRTMPSSSAPVIYTDNFNYPASKTLSDCDYATDSFTPTGAPFDFYATGRSMRVDVDPQLLGSDLYGQYAATVACHIPHGRAQRCTLSITDADFEDLEVGDSFNFVLAVHSTHQLGPALPNRYGVFLEIHLVRVASSTSADFQVTHRIIVVPDDTTQVQIFECHNHTSGDDIKGCWEISLDAWGHVYHYWRRRLVYSSQTSPPNTPGPVYSYFGNLSASLLAISDPKYGAIGFGSQYAVSPHAKFFIEASWLSIAAEGDIYDEVPGSCPGSLPPIGIPTEVDIPLVFYTVPPGGHNPPGNPGAQCCPPPNAVDIGDVLATDSFGNPTVWVTGCNELISEEVPEGKIDGYTTNISAPWCFPCGAPSGTPTFYDVPDDWPQEGTEGAIIVHGIEPLPPYIDVIPDTPGFTVVDAVPLNLNEFLLKYQIADGYAGTTVGIDINNPYTGSTLLTVPSFVEIDDAPPVIDTINWVDQWTKNLTVATAGYPFDVTINGSGFDLGSIVSSPTAGVTVLSYLYVSPSQMVAEIELDFLTTRGQLITIEVSDGAATGSKEVLSNYPIPIGAWLDISATTPGIGRTGTIYGNLFPSNVEVTAVNPALVANLVPIWVDENTVNFTMDIIGFAGQVIEFEVKDPDGGGTITMPVCEIDDAAPPSVSSASTIPVSVYEAARDKIYEVTAFGSGFGPASYIFINSIPVGPLYGTEGDIHTTVRAPTSVKGEFWVPCSTVTGVDVSVFKPGVGSDALPAAFNTLAVPATSITAGTAVWSGGLRPGASGTVTFPFTGGLIHLTDIQSVVGSDLSIDLGTRIQNPASLDYDYQVAAGAVPATTVSVFFANGACDTSPSQYDVEIDYDNPVITSVDLELYEDMTGVTGKIYGSGFYDTPPGTLVVAGTGNITVVSSNVISDTEIEVTVDNGSPGAAGFFVTNSNGDTSPTYALTILAEEAPVIYHAELVPSVTGTFSTLYVYGRNLYPPGAAYVFTGFSLTATNKTLPTYLEFEGTITAAAGNDVFLDITSTSHSYLNLYLDTATASPGGDVLVHDIGNPNPVENQTSVLVTISGENLDQVATVEAEPFDAARQALRYVPAGVVVPVSVSIAEIRPDNLVLSVDLEKGLTPNDYNFLLYDGGMSLLTIAPQAIHVEPSLNAPVISDPVRLLLDAAIPSGTGLSWMVVFEVSGPTPWMFGDQIVGYGFTVDSSSFNPSTNEWTVEGTNGAPASDWQLTIERPAISGVEEGNYRIPGGVVT
jgi:hypothetical protein